MREDGHAGAQPSPGWPPPRHFVWIVSADCGDYYCGCGIGHLVGIATSEENAERLRQEGEAATHSYESHGSDGQSFKSYYDVTVKKVTVDQVIIR